MAATPVKMPELGESITEGTITRWLKQEGDRVEVDEPLFEISTDKVDTEVPSPVAGVLKTIRVQVDETVEVGAELAVIEQDGAAAGGQPEAGGEEQAEAGGAESEAEAEAAEAGEGEAEGEAGEGEGREAVAAEAAEAEPGGEEAGGGEQPAAAEGEDRQAQAGDQEQQAPPRAAASGDGDTTTVRMPELGESITEGTITRWLKQEGDQVQVDEPLFEVSTDKVDTEIPSPVAGVLQSIKVQTDETVEVGAELAVIGTAGGAGAPAAGEPTDQRAEGPPAEAAEAAEEGAGAEAERAAQAEGDGKPKGDTRQRAKPGNGKAAVVSPLVRRLAREHGIDLSEVEGTGSGGRVRREDVEAYVERRGKEPAARPAERPAERPPAQRPAAAAPSGTRVAVPLPKGLREEVVPATRLRRLIAERMVSSLQTSAQLTSALEVDMTKVMRLRARAKDAFKQREGVSLSPLPFCVLALVGAVKQHPNVNSAMDDDGNLHLYKDVHLGVAVDTPKGLYVPVVKNADSLNLAGIAKAIADVAARTREGKIRPDELSGSTITVTNTGSRGVVWDTPIINQPNAAIFATPAIVKRPVVVEDPELGEVVAVRQVMQGVLTYDHRIIDGADAARFLNTIKELLEEADFEGELGLPKE